MGARILIVGDRPVPALAGVVAGLGHAVCGNATPREAVERASAVGPDLVLVDLDGKTPAAGVGAAERLVDGCGAPVVCLVDGAAVDAAGELLRPGRTATPFGFVVRPIDPRQLRLSIDAALALHDRARTAADADVAAGRENEGRLRRAVAELGQQRRLMEAVLQSMHDGVIAVDVRGRRLFVNEAARLFFDMETRADAPLNERLKGHGIFHPDGVTPYPVEDIPINLALRGEASAGVELFLRNPRRPDGLPVTISGAPTRDESGAVQAGWSSSTT